jgi:phosphoglycolate phosphatase
VKPVSLLPPLDFRRKRLIIYDLDGTLVDTREDIADAANHMRIAHGLIPLDDEKIWKFVGKGLFHLIQQCLATEDPKAIRRGSKIYRAHYTKHMLDKSKLYAGARECLELFKGIQQVVITNKPNPYAETILKELCVYRYLSRLVAGENEFPFKPEPASTLALMAAAKVTPNETLWVGDSDVDIETARNAGVHVAALTHGFVSKEKLKAAKPDRLFKDFRALINAAKQDLFGGMP